METHALQGAPTWQRTSQTSQVHPKDSQDSLQTPLSPHLHGAVVGVTPGAVPVTGHRFGVQSSHNPKVLADAVEDEPSHPEVIPHLDAFAWAHLEFPLEGESGCTREDGQACSPPATTSPPPRQGVKLSFTPWESATRMRSIELSSSTALACKKMGINCW